MLVAWPEQHKLVHNAVASRFADVEKITDVLFQLQRQWRRDQAKAEIEEHIGAVLAELGERGPQLLVDYYVRPGEHTFPNAYWHSQGSWGNPVDRDAVLDRIALELAAIYITANPSQYSADALIERVRGILSDPDGHREIPKPEFGSQSFRERYLFPDPATAFEKLALHLDFEGVLEFLTDIFRGRHSSAIDLGRDYYDRYTNTCAELIGTPRHIFEHLLTRLVERGALTPSLFEEFCKHDPYLAHLEAGFGRYGSDGIQGATLVCYRECLRGTLANAAARLPEDAGRFARLVNHASLCGLEWLEMGLSLVVRLGYGPKDLKGDDAAGVVDAVRALLNSEGLAQGETQDQLLSLLRRYDEATLLTALPYAGCARNAILLALGWDELVEMQNCLFAIAGGSATATDNPVDVPNSDDPESGVIDRPRVLDALQRVKPARLDKYIRALRASRLQLSNSLMLLDAVRDKDRAKIEKKLDKHGQCAIKAYGLYPVADEQDVRDRYLRFKAMHKQATQYGPERQANTQAAVKAGLKNLAQTAGYADEIRLEWAMEADIAEAMVPMNTPIAADAWEITLELEGIAPRIRISKDGKTLKSVPAKVRQQEAYKQMREAQDAIKGQASRFRRALEDMMCRNESISETELSVLDRLPVVRSMLRQMIMVTGDGQTGIFVDASTLEGLEGNCSVSGPLRIAHVFDLFKLGELSAWQRYVVERRLVQPFKQAFRELYILTPAEMAAGTHSRRFEGQVIDGRVASRLLQARGWTQLSGDVPEVYKRYREFGVTAEILFPEARHYLAEDERVEMGEVLFRDADGDMSLDKVDSYIFSETMRDADLLASVAQAGDEDNERWSAEAAERRADLVRALVSGLGLADVTCEGHFAYVQGKRAAYRIHLGSGAIHLQPGNYLCIVPAGDRDESLYLPFADVDNKMAEIISKIFLLMDDDKITDRSILQQIESGRRASGG